MSCLLGRKARAEAARKAVQENPLASEQLERMIAHLGANCVETSGPALGLGDAFRMDPETDTCIGPNAAAAGALAMRTYRAPFVLPG